MRLSCLFKEVLSMPYGVANAKWGFYANAKWGFWVTQNGVFVNAD